MKKYAAPEMEMMDFIVDENITASFDSIFNDGQFSAW